MRAVRLSRGFTLLEIMLVLLLMGLIVGTVSMTAFSTSEQDKLKQQAQRFQVVCNMASDFAVLNQQELGLRIEQGQYYFLVLDDDQKWQRIAGDKALMPHKLPDEFSIELQLDDLPWQTDNNLFDSKVFDEKLSVNDEEVEVGDEEKKQPPPQVLILSSGELTPFSLIFKYEPSFGDDNPVYFRVNAEDMPPLSLSEPLDQL